MPTSAMTALATITLGSTASSVTFGSIPATYRDLRLIIGNWTSTAENTCYVRVNGDTATNYSYVFMLGNGSSASSNSSSATAAGLLIGGLEGVSLTEIINGEISIFDYSATDKHKSSLARYNYAGRETSSSAARWASTAAITSLLVRISPSGSFNAGTTFSLYGIVS